MYIYEYNNVNYESLGFNIKNIDFKNLSSVNMHICNNVLIVSSLNNNSGSWITINSGIINVSPNSKLLLELDAKYKNTDQTTIRIIGITNKSTNVVLSYALIVAGNSSWKYYSALTSIPSPINKVIIQILIGWIIVAGHYETISVKGISLYNVL